MTVTISFTEATERKLRQRAAEHGQDVSDYVRSLVEKDLGATKSTSAGEKTFAEILTPVWEGFAESKMTDDEVAEFFEQVIQEVRRERRQETPPK
jgi:plasmid stability protein